MKIYFVAVVLFARIEYFNDIKKYICTTIRGMSHVYNSNF